MTTRTRDHYRTLDVREDASFQEMNAAFRRLAREFHPDRYVNASPTARAEAEAAFKEVSAAYAVLRDPDLREEYDRMLRGEAAVVSVEVDPPQAVVRTATGSFHFTVRLTVGGAVASELPMGVICDDPSIELQSVELWAAEPDARTLHVTVRGRVLEGGSRLVLIAYTAGAAVAVQSLQVVLHARYVRGALRLVDLSRFGGFFGWLPYAFVALGGLLLLSAAAGFTIGERGYAAAVLSVGVGFTIVGLFLILRNRVIQHIDMSSRWTQALVIGGSFGVINILYRLAEHLF